MKILLKALFFSSCLAFYVGATSSDKLKYPIKTTCKKFKNEYAVDELFEHPMKSCTMCRCCNTGKVKCFKKKCPVFEPSKCGKKFLEAVGIDGCCTKCNSTCVDIVNTGSALNCPGGIVYYDDEDTSPAGCTGVCGSIFRGQIVPNGPITDPSVAHPCEKCSCANGQCQCESEATCPPKKLECVNPRVDDATCQWFCPDGPTCWKGDIMLLPNVTDMIGGEFCTCLTDPWWPFAACGNQGHEAAFEKMLQDEMCVKTPIIPTAFNK